ncbi:hypothetical protein RINTHM_12290 [Richelia intracellularis HM01]|nr:hypothetical protein RINTHM_12290 [Richelia intracellularis HM01]
MDIKSGAKTLVIDTTLTTNSIPNTNTLIQLNKNEKILSKCGYN